MSYDEDHIAMAAEYVLGTLDGEERAQVETMMSVDPEFKLVVEQWERRLGELHAMVGAVEPADEVWGKIRTAVTAIAPETAMRLPEVTSVPAAVVPPLVQEITPDGSNVVSLSDRGRRWRGLAQLTTALAACLGAFIAVQAYRPDLLPERLRPQGKTEVVQVQAPAPAQFVAVLQRDGGSPAFIMTLDTSTKEFTVRKAGSDAPAGRSYELWMVPAGCHPAALARRDRRDRLHHQACACGVRQCDDPRRDLCGDGRAGRRLADRRADDAADLCGQADRDGAGGIDATACEALIRLSRSENVSFHTPKKKTPLGEGAFSVESLGGRLHLSRRWGSA